MVISFAKFIHKTLSTNKNQFNNYFFANNSQLNNQNNNNCQQQNVVAYAGITTKKIT